MDKGEKLKDNKKSQDLVKGRVQDEEELADSYEETQRLPPEEIDRFIKERLEKKSGGIGDKTKLFYIIIGLLFIVFLSYLIFLLFTSKLFPYKSRKATIREIREFMALHEGEIQRCIKERFPKDMIKEGVELYITIKVVHPKKPVQLEINSNKPIPKSFKDCIEEESKGWDLTKIGYEITLPIIISSVE